MLFSQFKQLRMFDLIREQWGDIRIPDLIEVLEVARPKRVFEVGSYQGVSTEFWALHCERVMSVDPSPNLDVRRRLLARVGHYPNVTLIEGRSPWVPADFNFDLVYLDGDHSYEAVRAELETYTPLLDRGCWIGGHDYTDTPAPGDGVKRAVDEKFGAAQYSFSDGSWLVNIGDYNAR
jgi:predicted O-methyltransferase YrrM